MESGNVFIGEAVRKDKGGRPAPRPDSPALIDLDDLQEFKPVPVCMN